MRPTLRPCRACRIAWIDHPAGGAPGVVNSDQPAGARRRTRRQPCATTRRASRRCSAGGRATVCSLMTNTDAISRLVRPAATRRSTSSSRALRPCSSVTGTCGSSNASTRATSGSAPRPRQLIKGDPQFELGRILVRQCAAAQPEQHPGARRPRSARQVRATTARPLAAAAAPPPGRRR